MADNRTLRAKKNIVVSLSCQLITLVCGLVVPRLMLATFGSEVYGATTSIAQFLGYITLLEGGIGGVARAVLYKPLANNDSVRISAIMAEVRRFFRIIAIIFGVYVLILAFSFRSISHLEALDAITSFALVIVISISTFGQYFIGITNAVLLQAAQRSYVTNLVNIGGVVVNTLSIFLLVSLKCHILTVKLVSSCIFFMRPVVLWLYVRKKFRLPAAPKTGEKYLTQKWSGLGQHIAYFLHSNTDVAVLTCLADLKTVAVYTVYHMVVANIQNLASSFVAGMEALFGDMLAKEEYPQLHSTFSRYETLISAVSMVLFSTTAVMILPFVQIYTRGITDADYHAPVFSLLLVLSSVCYCLRLPYHSLVIAAGHFKRTQAAAYCEAALNVGISVVLVSRFGLVGVAIGTILATVFRFVYYVVYLSKNIFHRKIRLFVRRTLVNALIFACVYAVGTFLISRFEITGYLPWACCAGLVTLLSAALTLGINAVFYPQDARALLKKYLRR